MDKQKHFYLIRGLIREAEHWHDFPRHLREAFPGAKVTAIDIPGAGEYYTSPTPLSIRGMVEVMHRKFLAVRTKGEESVLVAVSLGGMIASCWMKHHPEDFKEAVLINTSFGGFSPVYHRLRPEALLYLLKVPFLKGRSKEEHILKLVSNNPARFHETLDLWEKICHMRPVSHANTIRQLLAAAAFNIGKFSPTIPVYLLGSTTDRMVSIHCSRTIAKAWQVPLVEHPEGGHDLTADHPEWVASQIKSLISS